MDKWCNFYKILCSLNPSIFHSYNFLASTENWLSKFLSSYWRSGGVGLEYQFFVTVVLRGVNLGFIIFLMLNCFSNWEILSSDDVENSVSENYILFLLMTLIDDFSSFKFFVSSWENISSIFSIFYFPFY